MITDADLSRLRVPLASLPGLVPVGLRVVSTGERGGWVLPVGLHRDRYQVASPDGLAVGSECIDWDDLDFTWAYDLQDSSTADRVARWVADRRRVEVGCTAPEWGVSLFNLYALRTITIRSGREHYHRWEAPRVDGSDLWSWYHDDRLLPDGSRYVDRLSLTLVAVLVGSQP